MAGFGSMTPDDSTDDDLIWQTGQSYNQPFGELKPGPQIMTSNPRVQFYPEEGDRAIGLVTGFSGGGLPRRLPGDPVDWGKAIRNFLAVFAAKQAARHQPTKMLTRSIMEQEAAEAEGKK